MSCSHNRLPPVLAPLVGVFFVLWVAFFPVNSFAGFAVRQIVSNPTPGIINQGVLTTVAVRQGAANAAQYSTALQIGSAAVGGLVQGAVSGGYAGAAVGAVLAAISAAGIIQGIGVFDDGNGGDIIGRGTFPDNRCYFGSAVQPVADIFACYALIDQHIENTRDNYDGSGIAHTTNWVQTEGDWEKTSIKVEWTEIVYGQAVLKDRFDLYERWIGSATGVDPVDPAEFQAAAAQVAAQVESDNPGYIQSLYTDSNGNLRPEVYADPAIEPRLQKLQNLGSDGEALPSGVVETAIGVIPSYNDLPNAGGGGNPDPDLQQVEFETICEKFPGIDACVKTLAETNIDCSVAPTCTGNKGLCSAVEELWRNRCVGLPELQQKFDELSAEGVAVATNVGQVTLSGGQMSGGGDGLWQTIDVSGLGSDLADIFNVKQDLGECPPNKEFNLLGHSLTLNSRPFCDFADMIRPVVFLVGVWLSMMIVVRAVQRGV